MKDTYNHPADDATSQDLEKTYQAAVARLEAKKRRQIHQGYAVMSIASGAAGGYREDPTPMRAVVWAQRFCILFAFLVPSLLMWRVML